GLRADQPDRNRVHDRLHWQGHRRRVSRLSCQLPCPVRPNSTFRSASRSLKLNKSALTGRGPFWLAAAREALKAAAPYHSPKLHAIAMQTSPLDDRQEADVDPRQTMLEMYFGLATWR